MSEHLDLRHIMGAGIAITRGSAASLSFCYSMLLLTMCRNLITKMKEHSLHQYIPLDSHLQFHKIVACTGIPSLTRNSTNAIFTNAIFFSLALFFSIMHAAGHLVNFYHVGTQPIDHLHCMTKEMRFATDQRPGIDFWFFQVL
jgi:dual oxidase